jgi:hypothetical protein
MRTSIGERIRKARDQKGLDQATLAAKAVRRQTPRVTVASVGGFVSLSQRVRFMPSAPSRVFSTFPEVTQVGLEQPRPRSGG